MTDDPFRHRINIAACLDLHSRLVTKGHDRKRSIRQRLIYRVAAEVVIRETRLEMERG